MRKDIYRKGIVLGVIFLFVGAGVVPSINGDNSNFEDMIYVDDDAVPPYDGSLEHPYKYIQDGIDNASDGDTIYVFNGTYYENVVIVNVSLTLEGEDKESTIIDGGGAGDVVKLTTNSITISNFTIRNSGTNVSPGLIFDAGIHICPSSKSNNILDNNISFNCFGILVEKSLSNTIDNNVITDNTVDGVGLYGNVLISYNNIISNNIIQNNNEMGIFLWTSSGNDIKKNIITNNFNGIDLKYSSRNNLISHNNITWSKWCPEYPDKSGCGIYFQDDCSSNEIKNNNINNNSDSGVKLRFGSISNYFFHNNFIDNGRNAYFESCLGNEWDQNYWDDWIGLKSELFTHFPKVILGRYSFIPWLNFDSYPLEYPWKYL